MNELTGYLATLHRAASSVAVRPYIHPYIPCLQFNLNHVITYQVYTEGKNSQNNISQNNKVNRLRRLVWCKSKLIW